MSEPKFTRGPWAIKRDGTTIIAIGPIAVEDYAGCSWLKVSEEDALVAAAAPELFACLQATFDMIGDRLLDDVFGYEWLEKAKAALAKARGES